MSIIFEKTDSMDTEYVSYQITNDAKEDIGTAEGSGNKNGKFVSIIKIYNPKFQKAGLGFISFKKVFDEINSNRPISIIQASWHKGGEFKDFEKGMSTNLLIFKNNLSVMSEKESIFSTPTGKWVQKIGFNNYEIVSNTDEEVIINFTN
jgi:hypothetical protein